jgi:imidazolonepropionase-like amidohydrolase
MSGLLVTARRLVVDAAQPAVDDGAVLVDAGRVVAAGPAAEVERRAPAGVRRLAYPGGTVVPGLVDAHVHLAFDASADVVAALQAADDATLLLGMASRARKLLDAGVTTVRDLGDRGALAVRLRDAVAAGTLPGPRILTATSPITLPGGHCWFLGGEAEGVAGVRAAVRRAAAAGADVVKVMATGGLLTPGGPGIHEAQYGAAELRAIVEEAHGLGLPVAAHAHGTDGIAASVAAGVDTVEHCTWLGPAGVDVRPEVVEALVTSRTWVCPALSRNWKGLGPRFGEELTARLLGELGRAEAAGVRLAAGTDTGIPGAVFGDYVGALEVFEHVGFAVPRILELATSAAAEAIGLGDRTGRLLPGHDADLAVVAGDPLTNLQSLREVHLVVARGRPHVPPAVALGGAG